MKTIWMICAIFLLGVVAYMKLPIVETYVSLLTEEGVPVVSEDTLKNQIKERASSLLVEPKDARIDPVWKKVPGINGLKVDVESSYKKMKEVGEYKEELLVFEQVSPQVLLKDLKAAPIYIGHPDKEMVSLMINVAWGNEYIPGLLSTLKEEHVKATFFLEGNWTKKNPELAKTISEAGHEIANHSFSHPNMSSLTRDQNREEIVKTNDVIEATTGKTPTILGPPSGDYSQVTVDVAHELGMYTVLWSIDTIDWQKPPVSKIMERVSKKMHSGGTILMHPTESTVEALPLIIQLAKQKDLRIGTISDLLDEERLVKK
ncbi:polysaccharide deacetylase family protein [Mangrovibacillus cuniculi]|uniref:Polysaccharide deacetylase family protein n=1 Tax=Mangrovibacillus cuniculi TaxID=2593652 RepID=A0A7S8CE89_9BACI|nr:polysaccharide deacetylase family protein [Mangrovibacillus cuniculi]QPC48363.1 polysaccharide deacetylase family protein [Mangrovibacillus cuniculi]